ncbi:MULTISPECIES: FKBP-type peptidyl-prolyl cis-trans isomerase [unclassified Leeuwenhoekiella]|uniref:FKBP-type peptidyl-prolyl cis-trans isomerase n=1 Tax=unclassified Leeuwenhoekiella TaxID=2615029 RepID=UPI000C4605F8|nr:MULTISPECIES: FKBP-type peptidyl-prolyl cis-trans isomerase [unclassified Leeuwenhoekiella]MAW96102.1 peptidylprolyl isomerase [Leeuwenhoekiella sp.]MBA80096.1 peptidylprolyl isomerase [Leeuwenhoekiella sp.]|tara:strand:- start:18974 stop:19708 length:735 start_codon:yes stop_codon:yes gene_type:complete
MKLNKVFLALPVVALTLVNCDNSKMSSGDVELKTFKDSVSYMIGANSGAQFKQALGDNPDELFDLDVYEAGVRKGFTDSLEFSQQTMQALMTRFQTELRAKQEEAAMAKAAEAKEKGAAFLKENATKEGVQTTDSGLQYIVVEEGSGDMPTATDQVEVKYEGSLIDGTVFDGNMGTDQTATFGVSQVIKGWTEGLQLMKEGAKYKFFIPSDLAYGDRGSGPRIGPGETLIFDVELIDVKDNAQQ